MPVAATTLRGGQPFSCGGGHNDATRRAAEVGTDDDLVHASPLTSPRHH
ncbi:hypothetical protein L083_3471 [Actinoplanes sp. N902-109]|nr:hypothetical protein L083_3471 [Actinoplanes sp. N902-109]